MARISGYSERLIVKAEAGGSLSRSALEDLAEALSTSSQVITFEDLTSDPLFLARQFIGSLYEHQTLAFSKIRYMLHDEVVFRMAGDPKNIPFAGEFRGLDAVEQLFCLFFAVLEAPKNIDHMSNFEFISRGNDVIVWGESWLHPIGQKLESPMPFSNLIRFQSGKLIFLDDHYDTAYANQVVEASSHKPPA